MPISRLSICFVDAPWHQMIFVLQVKQAKYVVDQLIFVEFRESYRLRNRRLYNKSYHLQHEMFLLRANLLHAINAINNCVLTTFHTAGEIFMKKNSSQSIDIETMIQLS
ncbi:unnamed protein product [Didymodactylos carnosus]|uniref:Uncharacterized protein n=1 Tax=Didymodactylos carnosus TaxID=1234261 RepID=A0A8S2E8L4_9BILA|nr:unnamed protein product [Didymodactylos carnosus]CAF3972663.1 unnamed protein product [Didymodactylos carnosus]